MKVGDLVRFAGRDCDDYRSNLTGILLKVFQPKGLEKPIARVFWFSMKKPLQHLPEQLEIISENR